MTHFPRVQAEHCLTTMQLSRCFIVFGDFSIELDKRNRPTLLFLLLNILLSFLHFLLPIDFPFLHLCGFIYTDSFRRFTWRYGQIDLSF